MLAVLLAYYRWGAAKSFFEAVEGWKLRYGYGFSLAVTAFSGAVLPEILRIAVFQRGAPCRRNLDNLVFGVPFWGFMGVCVDAFYRGQALWFGEGATAAILIKKIIVDQFVYTPIWGTPAVVWAYEWKKRSYSFHDFGSLFGARFFKSAMIPAQIAGWAVWIPGVAIVYSLPLPLQIPLFALAEAFWSMLIAYMMSETAQPALTGCPEAV